MSNKLIRVVNKQYIPGTPGVPPTPARCYLVDVTGYGDVGGASQPTGLMGSSYSDNTQSAYERSQELGGDGTYGLTYQPVYTDSGLTTGEQDVNIYGSYNLATGYTPLRNPPPPDSQTVQPFRLVCDPPKAGQPGTPGRFVDVDGGPDWNSSAHSIIAVPGDAYAEFDVAVSGAIAIGFSVTDTGSHLSDIRDGVLLTRTGVNLIAKVIKDGTPGVTIGSFTTVPRFRLQRANGKFSVSAGGTGLYETTTTVSEPVYLDAMLYTSSDYVANPELGAATYPEYPAGAVLPYPWLQNTVWAAVGFTGGFSLAASVAGSLGFSGAATTAVDGKVVTQAIGSIGFTSAVTTQSTESVSAAASIGFTGDASALADDVYGTIVLPAFRMTAAESDYAFAALTLPAFSFTAYSNAAQIFLNGAELSLAPFVMSGVGRTGEIMKASLALPSLTMVASEGDYGMGAVKLPAFQMFADDGFGLPNYYGWNENMRITSAILPDPTLIASFYENLDLSENFSLAIVLEGAWVDSLLMDEATTVSAILSAMIESGVNLSSATQMPNPEFATYAFNSMTGAATRYDAFDFLGYTRVDGDTYAIRSDGLYRLRAGDDDGVPRSALVDFGSMAFGTSLKKNIETMFLGLDTDGTVYAQLSKDDGGYTTYRVVQGRPTMRVHTGRGATAREWALRLEVVDATTVDLSEVEFQIGVSTRRWTK